MKKFFNKAQNKTNEMAIKAKTTLDHERSPLKICGAANNRKLLSKNEFTNFSDEQKIIFDIIYFLS